MKLIERPQGEPLAVAQELAFPMRKEYSQAPLFLGPVYNYIHGFGPNDDGTLKGFTTIDCIENAPNGSIRLWQFYNANMLDVAGPRYWEVDKDTYSVSYHELSTKEIEEYESVNAALVCETHITDDIVYSNNFDRVCIVTLFILIILFIIPYKFVKKVMGRWLKW